MRGKKRMKLNIGPKVNALIIASLLLVGGLSVVLSVRALNTEGRKSINDYKNAVMSEKKQNIKGMVDAAYTIAKARLDESRDKNKISREFSSKVRSAVDQAYSVLQSAYKNDAFGDMEARKAAAIIIIKNIPCYPFPSAYF